MAFQIRDLLADVWTDEHAGYLLGCEHPSCGKSGNDGGDGGGDDGDDDDKGGHKGGHQGDHKKGGGKGEPKYAAAADLVLLQQQLRQSLSLEL
jgi:hypothetical protein